MRSIKFFMAAILLLAGQFAFAAASPISMLQTTSDNMLAALKKAPNRKPDTLYKIVDRLLVPKVDLNLMAKLVVNQSGRQGNYWAAATAQQKVQFKKAFVHYLVNTYAGALANYSDEKIVFSPRIINVAQNRVQVNSRVLASGGRQPVSLNYRLVKIGGQWKVYDLIVDSISMVNSYNEQFGPVLRQGGMSLLLKRLAK